MSPPSADEFDRAVVVTFSLLAATPQAKVPKAPVRSPVKTPVKTPEAIRSLLRSDPTLSLPEVAAQLGKSLRAIERAVRNLREAGRLERIGPDKGGRWKVPE